MDSTSDDFASAIVEANKNDDHTGRIVGGYPVLETDEFGFDRTERNLEHFLVARTLAFNQQYKAEEAKRRMGREPLGLHTRKGRIYQDNHPIEETSENMYKLTRWYQLVQYPRMIGYWETLRAYLPRLCFRYVEMANDMYWDLKTGALVCRKDLDESAF